MEISKDWFIMGGSSDGKWGASNVSLPEGILGKGLHLDGALILDFGNARSGCFMTPDLCQSGFTLSFWLKHTDVDSVGCYLSSGGDAANSVGVAFMYKENGAFLVKTTEHEYDYGLPFYLEQWTQFTITWHDDPNDVQSTLNLYVNGTRSDDVTASVFGASLNGSSARNRIAVGGSNEYSNQVSGFFDELLYWDRELSAEEVVSVYKTHTGMCLAIRTPKKILNLTSLSKNTQ